MPSAPATEFRIVINYRRDDTAGHAGRLYDSLAERFGHDHVFMDIDAIEPGVDFTKVLERAVDACDAFISLIGRQWLTITDDEGRRRLDDPGDFVRLEIEAALERDIRVIPVLVQEADMPAHSALPDSLAPLAYRNAFEVRDTRWRSDVEQLIKALEKIEREKAGPDTAEATPPPPPERPERPEPVPGGRRTPVLAAAAAGVLLLGVLLAVLLLRDGGDEDVTPTTTAEEATTATETGPPDGQGGGGQIVYGDGTRLWVVDAAGSKRERGPVGAAPEWSPAARRVAFVQRGRIVTANESGGEVRRLTPGRPRDSAPAWSSDGMWIAFDRQAGGGRADIWVIEAEGGGERNLTKGEDETGGAPDWSPNGTRIVYQRQRELWMMNGDGSGERKIEVGVRGTKLSPAWSPDGGLIAFAVYPTGKGESHLYVMRPDGSAPRRLTRTPLYNVHSPAWSADGKRIAFTAEGALWVIRADGGPPRHVLSGPRVESPSWISVPES